MSADPERPMAPGPGDAAGNDSGAAGGLAGDGELLWIEVLNRHREVLSRHRLHAAQVRVGRGYDNDLVLDDPHIAPQHLRIGRDGDGQLYAEDLDTLNGLYVAGKHLRQRRVALAEETVLRVGHTWLRVRTHAHSVPAELPLRQASPLWLIALLLFAANLGLVALNIWLNRISPLRPSHYLSPVLTIGAALTIWVGAWALVSRLFSGRAHLVRHLLIATAGYFIEYLYERVVEGSGYALSWNGALRFGYLGTWLLLGSVVLLHLRTVSKRHGVLQVAVVGALTMAAAAASTISRHDAKTLNSNSTAIRHLLPPAFRLAPVHDAEHFFAAAAELRGATDHARNEARNDNGDDDAQDDDE